MDFNCPVAEGDEEHGLLDLNEAPQVIRRSKLMMSTFLNLKNTCIQVRSITLVLAYS
jgi:hypothetical protein